MKQYTTPEQTTKLIELGFEKKKVIMQFVPKRGAPKVALIDPNFSIGELIEMLPEAICTSHDDSYHYYLSVDTNACWWRIRYKDDFDVPLSVTYDGELIDALCDMVIKLKEEGVI